MLSATISYRWRPTTEFFLVETLIDRFWLLSVGSTYVYVDLQQINTMSAWRCYSHCSSLFIYLLIYLLTYLLTYLLIVPAKTTEVLSFFVAIFTLVFRTSKLYIIQRKHLLFDIRNIPTKFFRRIFFRWFNKMHISSFNICCQHQLLFVKVSVKKNKQYDFAVYDMLIVLQSTCMQ